MLAQAAVCRLVLVPLHPWNPREAYSLLSEIPRLGVSRFAVYVAGLDLAVVNLQSFLGKPVADVIAVLLHVLA